MIEKVPVDSRRVDSDIVGTGELARRLGVSVRHIRRLVGGNRIPYMRIGSALRFDYSQVKEATAGGKAHAKNPPACR